MPVDKGLISSAKALTGVPGQSAKQRRIASRALNERLWNLYLLFPMVSPWGILPPLQQSLRGKTSGPHPLSRTKLEAMLQDPHPLESNTLPTP
jgi:hypothetical protein